MVSSHLAKLPPLSSATLLPAAIFKAPEVKQTYPRALIALRMSGFALAPSQLLYHIPSNTRLADCVKAAPVTAL
jgi:hypothetical protein